MLRGGKRGAFRGSYCPSSVLTANTGQVCPGQVTCSPELCLRDLAAWPRVHGDPASWRLSVLKCSVVPPIAPSSHLVRAGWLANRGTEPEATGRVLSKTVGLGPRHPLTHSTAQTTLAGDSGPGVRSRLRRGHTPSHGLDVPTCAAGSAPAMASPPPPCPGSPCGGSAPEEPPRKAACVCAPGCTRTCSCAHRRPLPRLPSGRGEGIFGLHRRRFNYRFSAAGRWARVAKEGEQL